MSIPFGATLPFHVRSEATTPQTGLRLGNPFLPNANAIAGVNIQPCWRAHDHGCPNIKWSRVTSNPLFLTINDQITTNEIVSRLHTASLAMITSHSRENLLYIRPFSSLLDEKTSVQIYGQHEKSVPMYGSWRASIE